jgi:hypothetical protein
VPSYTSAIAYDKEGKVIKEWKGEESHYENFAKAIRSRKYTDLNGEILEGHISSALCHTGNISYQLGKKASPEEVREKIKGDKGALETFERMVEHLAANGVDIAKELVTLGIPLKMNPKTEKFIGSAKGDELLTRPYRPGFVVPAKA